MVNETIAFLNGIDINFLDAVFGIIGGAAAVIGVILTWKYFRKEKTIPIDFPFDSTTVQELPTKLNMTLAELPYIVRHKTTINARNGYLGTLVIGKPYSGKTKEAIEVLRKKRGDLTILVPEGKGSTWQFETVPQEIQGDVILFLDDLPNYYVKPKEFHDSLLKALEMLKLTCASVSVVATVRATELDKLYDYPGNGFWAKFEKIELGTFEQTDQLIDELCNELGLTIDADAKKRIVEENDGTPKNPVIFFVDLKNKGIAHVTLETAEEFKSTVLETWGRIYNDLSEGERDVFQALDVLQRGLVIPHKVFLVDLIRKQKSWFRLRRKQIENAIEMVREKRLITEQESIIRCDDAYREDKGDLHANIENLVAILLRRSRNEKLKIPVLLSLEGLSDVIIAQKEFSQQAVKIIQKIIELDPDLAEAHYNLGVLLDDLGRDEGTEREYKEAIRSNPDLAAAHYNLGTLLADLERDEEAEREYKEAIKSNPDFADAHYNLGVLLADLERYEEAEREYKEAIRCNLDLAEAHSNLGNLLGDLGRKEEAEKEYKEAIRSDPDLAEAHSNLGNLLRNDLERYPEAEWEYKEAIRSNPDLAEAHGNLGILYSQTGRVEEAKAELETAKRLFEVQGKEEGVKKTEELLRSLH